jgi:hypothetical protein
MRSRAPTALAAAAAAALLGAGGGEARAGEPAAAATPAAQAPAPMPAPPSAPGADGRGLDSARLAAQAELAEGNRRFKDGDYAEALAHYRKAQAIYPDTAGKVEFNVGKAEEALGNTDAAAEAFERFLGLPPTDLVTTLADYRAEAAAALRRLQTLLGRMQVVARDDGQAVVVDGRPRGTTPLSSLVRVLPGRHLVTLKAGDRVVFEQEIDVQAGDTVRIVVEKEARVPTDARVALVVPPPAAAAGNSQPAAALDLQAGPSTQGRGHSGRSGGSGPPWGPLSRSA